MHINLKIHQVALIVIIWFCSCISHHDKYEKDDEQMLNNNSPVENLAAFGDFFGEPPPGDLSELFSAGIISTYLDECSFIMSHDENRVFVTIRQPGNIFTIKSSIRENGIWRPLSSLNFIIEGYSYFDAFLTADGKKFYFSSNVPKSQYDTIKDYNVWEIDITDGVWGKPKICAFINSSWSHHQFSIAKNGNFYLSNIDYETKTNDIWLIQRTGDGYKEQQILSPKINSSYNESLPWISPDEDYIIFSSDRPGGYGLYDLYISFKFGNGKWSEPLNMGEKVNSDRYELGKSVTFNNKYIFFSSYAMKPFPGSKNRSKKYLNGSGNIYWISTSVIDELKEKAKAQFN